VPVSVPDNRDDAASAVNDAPEPSAEPRPYAALVHQVVVAALLRAPGEVLLCHRTAERRWYPSVWDFPGGHVERDERPLEALRREVLEEVGVAVDIGSLTEQPDLRLKTDDLDLSMWLVRAWAGEPVNCAPEEHDQLEWFDLNDAIDKSLTHSSYQPWLARLLAIEYVGGE